MANGQKWDVFTEAQLVQLEARWKSDIQAKVDSMDARVRVIERLVWIGVGGIVVLGGLVSIIGNNILRLLAHA